MMYQVKESLEIISSLPSLGRTEVVKFTDSIGRVLAQDIVADSDQPPFNKSAMDGYACRMEDLPGPLVIAGQIAAGSFVNDKLEAGNCYRIFTGAPVPNGSDCVIMQEHTTQYSKNKVIFTGSETKKNICYSGEDIKTGEIAIETGTLIQPQHIAVMAGFGVTDPVVAAKPRVGILCSGAELIEPHEQPYNAMIRNSNAYQLISQIIALGAEADYQGIVTDNKPLIIKSISNAITKCDVLIVTGGASIGDYDFMPSVLDSLGATIHFSGINIQPGKPILFATLNGTHIFALSGNPVSSYLQFHLIAKYLILHLAGCKQSSVKIIKVPLAETIKRKKNKRQLYIPVAFSPSGFAKPLPFNGSAHITALSGIDGFAIMEPDIEEVEKNQLANILIV